MNINDKQEVFNVVWKGLESQNWMASTKRDGTCQYRGIQNRKCAAGHLIPDEKYKKVWDQKIMFWDQIANKIYPEISEESISFVLSLQKEHDSCMSANMQNKFANFAITNNLTIPE